MEQAKRDLALRSQILPWLKSPSSYRINKNDNFSTKLKKLIFIRAYNKISKMKTHFNINKMTVSIKSLWIWHSYVLLAMSQHIFIYDFESLECSLFYLIMKILLRHASWLLNTATLMLFTQYRYTTVPLTDIYIYYGVWTYMMIYFTDHIVDIHQQMMKY